jgi:hypothetical protein
MEDCICRLENSYSTVVEPHPKFGYQAIKYDVEEFIEVATKNIALLLGDALHNLKSALDYAWIATLERNAPSAIGDKTQFPAYGSRDILESALRKTKIDVLSPALFDLMLTEIKAYSGGNDAIWDVKQLNILDKHKLLLPLVVYTSIGGLEMESESGEINKGGWAATFQVPPLYIRVPDGWHVKKSGKPSLDMLFGEGVLTTHLNARDIVEFYSIMIQDVVRKLERFCDRGRLV